MIFADLKMATYVHVLLLLFAACYGIRINQRAENTGNVVEVSFPDNFTNAILLALPGIQGAQNKMISLMNKTLISQDEAINALGKRLKNFEKSHNVQMDNLINLMDKMATLMERQSQIKPTNTEYYARECQDISVNRSGPYIINPSDGLGLLKVDCDFTDDHVWTVIQKRIDGSVSFYRDWVTYEEGFGDVSGEYWLGLKNIRRLISDGSTWALRVDLESFDRESAYAVYDSFSISDAASNYTLSVGAYSGTAGDSLNYNGLEGVRNHNGMQFTTKDRDNDGAGDKNCADSYEGAWWYNHCYAANLNGKYDVLDWYTWKQNWDPLKSAQMKIRRVD